MSVQALSAPIRSSTASISFVGAFRHAPVLAATAIVLLAMVAPTLMALSLDTRVLNGVNVWIKPLKFELSLVVYIATLAWFVSWLPQQERRSRRFRLWAIAVAVAAGLEMTWLIGAAYFGIASHFNRDNTVMMAVYPVMGALAVTITLASLAQGRAFLRHWRSSGNPAFHLSLGLGLVLTCFLTILVAGYMSNQSGHAIDGAASDAGGLNLLGWSRAGGDLRVAHFFSTHAMHVIPAIGYVAGRLLRPQAALRAVIVSSALFVCFVAYAFIEALQGKPFMTLIMG